MDKLLEKIFNLLDKLPVPFQILGLVFIFLVFLAYKLFNNKKVQNSIVLRLQKKLGNITSKDIQLHRLFSKREVYRNAINNIRFDSDNKTVIFQKILLVKLESDIFLARQFIEKEDLLDIDSNFLCTKMISQINLMVETYDNKALESIRFFYGEQLGERLFNFVMNFPGGFREKRADRINRIVHQIDNYLRESQVFDNNLERLEYFLTEVQYALSTAILEAEKMFADFNGEIDNLVRNEPE